jgi:Ca2+-binding RTX toxin-like protein
VSDQIVNVTTIDNEVITVAQDGDGNLTIDDNSTAGLADNLTLTIVSTDLVITDPDNVLRTSVGLQVSDHEVRVPLATITSQSVVVNHNQGNDRLNAAGLSASLSLVAAGGPGDDTLIGGAGSDTVNGGDGDDNLNGGAGTDTLLVTGNPHLRITTTSTFGPGTDLHSGFERAILEGDSANNRLDASLADFPVTLLGLGGNDTLLSGSGVDQLDGGDGVDSVEIIGSNIVLTNASAPGASEDTLLSVERLHLIASGPDSVIDASAYTLGPVTIIGSSGDDTLKGGSGNDVILAGSGNDEVSGGSGDDIIRGDSGADTLSGDAGDDTILGGGGRDLIDGNADADILIGGGGPDTIRGGTGDDFVSGGGGRDSIDGDEGADTLFGGGGADNLAGGIGDDTLNGLPRNDSFNAVIGQDTLIGGNRSEGRPAPARMLTPTVAASADIPFFQSPPLFSKETKEIDEVFLEPLLPELLEM